MVCVDLAVNLLVKCTRLLLPLKAVRVPFEVHVEALLAALSLDALGLGQIQVELGVGHLLLMVEFQLVLVGNTEIGVGYLLLMIDLHLVLVGNKELEVGYLLLIIDSHLVLVGHLQYAEAPRIALSRVRIITTAVDKVNGRVGIIRWIVLIKTPVRHDEYYMG